MTGPFDGEHHCKVCGTTDVIFFQNCGTFYDEKISVKNPLYLCEKCYYKHRDKIKFYSNKNKYKK